MTKEDKPDAWMAPKIRPGATRRLEVHVGYCEWETRLLTCTQVGKLFRMLMAEAAGAPIPRCRDKVVLRAWDRRDRYSRITGGFGRSRLSDAVRREVYERGGGVCSYCASEVSWADYHCDHVEPLKHGGSDHPENLAVSCRPCNLRKAGKPLSEWLH
jgi:5-methylcytosine-specific restriction endonuclease McrA